MVLEDPVCDQCNGALESPLHALWSCSELDVVWIDPILWSFNRTHMFMDFKELLSWIIYQDKDLELFAMIAWSIWTQRNQVRLAQLNVNLHLLAQVSKDWHEEFMALQVPRSLPQQVDPCFVAISPLGMLQNKFRRSYFCC